MPRSPGKRSLPTLFSPYLLMTLNCSSRLVVTPGVTRNRLVLGGIIDLSIPEEDFTDAELLSVLRAQNDIRANSLEIMLWMDQNLIECLSARASITSEVYLAYALLFRVLDDSTSGWSARCMAVSMLADLPKLFHFSDDAAWSGAVSTIISTHPRLESLGNACLLYLASTTADPQGIETLHSLTGTFDPAVSLVETAALIAPNSCLKISQDNKDIMAFRSGGEDQEPIFVRRSNAAWMCSTLLYLMITNPVTNKFVLQFGSKPFYQISWSNDEQGQVAHDFVSLLHQSALTAALATRIRDQGQQHLEIARRQTEQMAADLEDL